MTNTSVDDDELLTIEEAAAYLKVDPVTVQRELRHGRLPGNKVGRAWRLNKRALREHVAGGDLLMGMFAAEGDFHREDVDGGLRALLKHCAADRQLPGDFRADFLRRVTILAEAEERNSPEHALSAKYGGDGPALIDHRSSATGMSRAIVNLNAQWNKVVDKCAEAIGCRASRARLDQARKRMTK